MKDNDAEVLRPCALHGVDPKDDTYGPWMVVSRKKSSNRKDKKRDFAPTSAMHAMWNEGTDERGLGDMAKVTLGMVVLKINEGKRNANGELVGFGEPLEEQPGFKGKGISSDSPYKLGLFNQGTSKTYEGPSSIKGKKVLARLRATPAHSRGAKPREGNKSNKLLKSIWTRTNAASQSNNDGKFQFLSKSEIAWAIQVKGKIVEILAMVIDDIRTNPTHKMGWFNFDLKEAWRWIFPLTPMSAKLGRLPFSDPA